MRNPCVVILDSMLFNTVELILNVLLFVLYPHCVLISNSCNIPYRVKTLLFKDKSRAKFTIYLIAVLSFANSRQKKVFSRRFNYCHSLANDTYSIYYIHRKLFCCCRLAVFSNVFTVFMFRKRLG